MEDQLGTAPRILLPSVYFVVTSQGDAFFEFVVGVGCPAHNIAFELKSQRESEIFGNMRFGPDLLHAVLLEHDLLQRGPAQKGVMAYKWCRRSIGATKGDCQLDASGEVGDAVFEEMVRDLHDARGVLDDGDLGALFKLADCIGKTVFRNSSVGIDDQNIGSSKDRSKLSLATRISREYAYMRMLPAAQARPSLSFCAMTSAVSYRSSSSASCQKYVAPPFRSWASGRRSSMISSTRRDS